MALGVGTLKNALPLGHLVFDGSKFDLFVTKPERSEYTAPFWPVRVAKPSAKDMDEIVLVGGCHRYDPDCESQPRHRCALDQATSTVATLVN